MSGIVGSKLNIRGSGLVGSLGTDGQHLLSAGAGVSNVFETVAGGGMWTKIATQSLSSDTIELQFIDGTNSVVFDNTYEYYLVHFRNLVQDTADKIVYLQVTDDGGTSWKTSGYEGHGLESDYNASSRVSTFASMIAIHQMPTDENSSAFGWIWLPHPSASSRPMSMYSIASPDNTGGQAVSWHGGGAYLTAGAYDGFKFVAGPDGLIVAGFNATLYGHSD